MIPLKDQRWETVTDYVDHRRWQGHLDVLSQESPTPPNELPTGNVSVVSAKKKSVDHLTKYMHTDNESFYDKTRCISV